MSWKNYNKKKNVRETKKIKNELEKRNEEIFFLGKYHAPHL